jgi:hypothetical protein
MGYLKSNLFSLECVSCQGRPMGFPDSARQFNMAPSSISYEVMRDKRTGYHMEFVKKHNENPRIFTWTKDADTIPAKVAKCTKALGTGHYRLQPSLTMTRPWWTDPDVTLYSWLGFTQGSRSKGFRKSYGLHLWNDTRIELRFLAFRINLI